MFHIRTKPIESNSKEFKLNIFTKIYLYTGEEKAYNLIGSNSVANEYFKCHFTYNEEVISRCILEQSTENGKNRP